MHIRSIAPIAAVLVLAACNSSEEAAPAPQTAQAEAPTPVLTTAPVPTQAEDGSPLAAGVWSIAEDASGASASFGQPDTSPLLVLTCALSNRALSLAISNDAPGNQTFVIQAGGNSARLDTIADGNGEAPHQVAAIARDAPVFGGFVASGQTITVTYPGGNVLRIPAASGIRRVFEACA